MCFFGKKGGFPDPYETQRRIEAEKQKRINQAVGAVNTAFDRGNRNAAYGDVYQAVLGVNQEDLDRQYQDALRQARFAAARAGAGGSADAYAQHLLRERYDKGAQQVQTLAEQARHAAQGEDERTRQLLINQIFGGLSGTDASRLAFSGMQQALERARTMGNTAQLGDMFSDMAGIYGAGRQQAGVNIARNQFNRDPFLSYFPSSGASGYAGATS